MERLYIEDEAFIKNGNNKDFKVGDKVKTIVNNFDKTKEVRFGSIAYIHPKEIYTPFIVDFGDTWAGFSGNQIEEDA